jgi:hypothetical protein
MSVTKRDIAANAARLMHQAHLAYQRQQLAPSSSNQYKQVLGVSELRGLRYDARHHNAVVEFKPEWFTHLRPNFWKAYFDTLLH